MRRGAIVALISIALVVAAITTGIAYFVDWLPEQASEERQGIDLVLWVTVGICIFFFAVVAAVSIYSGVKFRVRPDDLSDGPPIHGHTGLEIVWTAVPTLFVTIIAVLSAVVLAQNDSPKGEPLRVEVLAQQYAWQFTYPEEGGIKATNLYLPIDRSTKLELSARDVLHSFWVPEFGQKQDAVPGIVTTVVITPTKTGRVPTDLHRALRARARADAHAGDRPLAGRLRRLDEEAAPGRRRGAAARRRRDRREGSLHRELRRVSHADEGGHERAGGPEPRQPLARAGGRRAADPRRAAAGCRRSGVSSRMTRSNALVQYLTGSNG